MSMCQWWEYVDVIMSTGGVLSDQARFSKQFHFHQDTNKSDWGGSQVWKHVDVMFSKQFYLHQYTHKSDWSGFQG